MFPGCFVLECCSPSHPKKNIQDHLSLDQHTFFFIKVLSYSVLRMHHFREYLNSSVPVTQMLHLGELKAMRIITVVNPETEFSL